jgi:DnaJ like chaperone protein
MTIWGKLLGGAAGLMIGGPIGALLGAMAGHAYDVFKVDQAAQNDAPFLPEQHAAKPKGPDPTKQIAFTIGVIALGAKMAKADGVVTRPEIQTFLRIFRIDSADMARVAQVFDLAKRESLGFESYARQIYTILASQPALLEELLDGLFHIAMADGRLHPAEEAYLKRVNELFGFSPADFARIKESHLGPDLANPYRVLGVESSADNATVKAAWKKLLLEHHPDRLQAAGLPEEAIRLTTEKAAAINAAWTKIKAEKGWE